jgi:16S rRNA G966 N2-methylase RsmD
MEQKEFPWIRNRIPDPNLLFHHLREYNPTITNEKHKYKYIIWKSKKYNQNWYQNTHISFITQPQDYENIDKLVDYFNEKPRMNAKRRDKKHTPIEVWENPKILEPWILQKKNLTNISIREQIWKLGYECNAFKATLAKSIYHFFKAKRILDFSAGWGDRLLAAIAHGAERYLGYDPNVELQPGYNEIISTFHPTNNTETKYEIHAQAFETANPIPETFDLVFTSPPYFDFEIYISLENTNTTQTQTQIQTQSIVKYPKLNDWIVHFLLVSLNKSWSSLEIHGNMVIHLSDVYKTHYVEIMILFILGWCKGSRFDGSIASIGDCGKPRPLWVFHKKENQTIDIDARKQLETHYSDLFRLIHSKTNLNFQNLL